MCHQVARVGNGQHQVTTCDSLCSWRQQDTIGGNRWQVLTIHGNLKLKVGTDSKRFQQIATDCNILQQIQIKGWNRQQQIEEYCNTLQHIATHCNTLQQIATDCNRLQQIATDCYRLRHIATYCIRLQETGKGHLPAGLFIILVEPKGSQFKRFNIL